jgi:hypothetical protein
MDGYVGLFGLTECCGGQQNSKRQDLHEYDSNNPLNPINDPFAVVLLVSYRRWLQKGKDPTAIRGHPRGHGTGERIFTFSYVSS